MSLKNICLNTFITLAYLTLFTPISYALTKDEEFLANNYPVYVSNNPTFPNFTLEVSGAMENQFPQTIPQSIQQLNQKYPRQINTDIPTHATLQGFRNKDSPFNLTSGRQLKVFEQDQNGNKQEIGSIESLGVARDRVIESPNSHYKVTISATYYPNPISFTYVTISKVQFKKEALNLSEVDKSFLNNNYAVYVSTQSKRATDDPNSPSFSLGIQGGLQNAEELTLSKQLPTSLAMLPYTKGILIPERETAQATLQGYRNGQPPFNLYSGDLKILENGQEIGSLKNIGVARDISIKSPTAPYTVNFRILTNAATSNPDTAPINFTYVTLSKVEETATQPQEEKEYPIYLFTAPEPVTLNGQPDPSDKTKFEFQFEHITAKNGVPDEWEDDFLQGYYNPSNFDITSAPIKFTKIDPNGTKTDIPTPSLNKVQTSGTQILDLPPYYKVTLKYDSKSEETGIWPFKKQFNYLIITIDKVEIDQEKKASLLQQQLAEQAAQKALENAKDFVTKNAPIYIQPINKTINNLVFTINIKDNKLTPPSILDTTVNGANFSGFTDANGKLLSGELALFTNNTQAAVLVPTSNIIPKSGKTYSIDLNNTPYLVTLDFTYTEKPANQEAQTLIPARYFIKLQDIKIDQQKINELNNSKNAITSKADALIKQINQDTTLTIPTDLTIPTPALINQAEPLKTRFTDLKTTLLPQIITIQKSVDGPSFNYNSSNDQLTNAKKTIDDLKTNVQAFLKQNQKELDTHLTNTKDNLNKRADALITKINTDLINKIPDTIDPALETDKTNLQNDANQLLQNVQNIKKFINDSQTTLTIINDNKDKLTTAEDQFNNLIKTLNNLIEQNTKNTDSRSSIKDRTQDLINSIFTNLEAPFNKAQPINPKNQNTATTLANDIATLKTPLITISTNVDKPTFSFGQAEKTLKDYEKKISDLKKRLDQFISDNLKSNEEDRKAKEQQELKLNEVKNDITFLNNNIPVYITTNIFKPNQIAFKLALTQAITPNSTLKQSITSDGTQASFAGYVDQKGSLKDTQLAIFMDSKPTILSEPLGKNASKQIPFIGPDNIPYIATINVTYKETPDIISQTKNLETLLSSQTPPLTIPTYAYIINLENVVINQTFIDAQNSLKNKAKTLQNNINTELIQKKATSLTTHYNLQTTTNSSTLDTEINTLTSDIDKFITITIPTITNNTNLNAANDKFDEYQNTFNNLKTQLTTLINNEKISEKEHKDNINNLNKRTDDLITKINTDLINKIPDTIDPALEINKTNLQNDANQLLKNVQDINKSINNPQVTLTTLSENKDKLTTAEDQFNNLIKTLNNLIEQNTKNTDSRSSIKDRTQDLINSIFTNLEAPFNKAQPINPKNQNTATTLANDIATLKTPLITISTNVDKPTFSFDQAEKTLKDYEKKISDLRLRLDQFILDNAQSNEEDRKAKEQQELKLNEVKNDITFLNNNIPVYITTTIFKPNQIAFKLALTKVLTPNPILKQSITSDGTQASFAGYVDQKGSLKDTQLAIFMDSKPTILPEPLGKNTSKQIPFIGPDNIPYIATINVTYKETPNIIAQTKNLETLLSSQTPPLTIPTYAYIINLENVVVNQTFIDAQNSLKNKAKTLQNNINTELIQKKATSLTTHYNPQTTTNSSTLDTEINTLTSDIDKFITITIPTITNNTNLNAANDKFDEYQNTFNNLKTQLTTLINNEKISEKEHKDNINNLNKRTDDLITKINTDLINKIPDTIDPALEINKTNLQNDANQLLKNVQDINKSINNPQVTLTTLSENKDKLTTAEDQFNNLIKTLNNLIEQNTKNTDSRSSIKDRTQDLINSIFTNLEAPFNKAQPINPKNQNTATTLANDIATLKTPLITISTNVDKPTFSFGQAEKTLKDYEKKISDLKKRLDQFISDNLKSNEEDRKAKEQQELKLNEVKNDITFLNNNIPVYITTNIFKPNQIAFKLALTQAITPNSTLKQSITSDGTQASFAGYVDQKGSLKDTQLAIFMDSKPTILPEPLGKNTSKQIPFIGPDNIPYIATINVTYKETPDIISQTKNLETLLSSQTPPLTIPTYAYIINLENVVVNQTFIDAQNSLKNKAKTLQNNINTELIQKKATSLTTHYNPQTTTNSSTLDTEINTLTSDIDKFITITIPTITNNTNLNAANDKFDEYQNTFNNIKGQLTTLIYNEKASEKDHNDIITKLKSQANALLHEIDNNPALLIPNTFTPADSSFDGRRSGLQKTLKAIRSSVETTQATLDTSTTDLNAAQTDLDNAQSQIDTLKTGVKTLLIDNQARLDSKLGNDKDSLNKKANDLIAKTTNDLVNKIPTTVDPLLTLTRDTLKQEADQLLSDLKDLQTAINAPNVSQTSLNQIRSELISSDARFTELKAALDNLLFSQTTWASKRSGLKTQANTLLHEIDNNPALVIPTTFTPADSSFDGRRTGLQNTLKAIRSSVETTQATLDTSTTDLNAAQTDLDNAQSQIDTLKTGVKTLFIDNQARLDSKLGNDKDSLNKKANDLIAKTTNDLVNKIPTTVDPLLTLTRDTLKEEADQLLAALKTMQTSINVLDTTQSTLDQIRNNLITADAQLTELLQALKDLLFAQPLWANQRDAIANSAAQLLHSIETELLIPSNFVPTNFTFAIREKELQQEIDQKVKQWITLLKQIQSKLYTSTFNFPETTKILDDTEKNISTLKRVIESLIQENDYAKRQEDLRKQKEAENAFHRKIQAWINKFEALKQDTQNLTDPEFASIKNNLEKQINDAEKDLSTLTPETFDKDDTQNDYNFIQHSININLAQQTNNRQEKENLKNKQKAEQQELESLNNEPAIYVDTTPFSFNNQSFVIDLLGQHPDKKNILKAKHSNYSFEGYANAQSLILPNAYLAILIKDNVKGLSTKKLPQNGFIIAEAEDKEGNPYIIKLEVNYSKNRAFLNNTDIKISDDELPFIYTISISDIQNNETKINEKRKAEESAKEKARTEAEDHQKASTSESNFISQHPPIYINQSNQSVDSNTLRLSLLDNTQSLKTILPSQLENFKLSGYATQNGTLYDGDIVIVFNNQISVIIASENSPIGQSNEKPITITLGNTTFTMKIKSELKTLSTLSPNLSTKAYFIEILPGSVQVKEKPSPQLQKPGKTKEQLHREQLGKYH